MIFSRTYRYTSAASEEDLKGRLLGKHMKIHDMDFEVSEKGKMLKIIPHAEQETGIRTLPITHVEFKGKGAGKTQVVVTAKMRKIDSGGPLLIMVFVAIMVAAALLMLVIDGVDRTYVYAFGAIGLLIFSIFWTRMQTGYFDYVRKIRDYIKKQAA